MNSRRIKSYKSFIDERINEGLVDWIKEKFSKIGEYFNRLKGKALVSVAASILPKELLEYIRLQAGASVSESVMMLEEVRHMGLGLGFNSDMLSPEELDALSDEEYDKYLQGLSDEILFQVDIEGNVAEHDRKLHDFLVSRGIEVNKEIVSEHKGSLDNIYRKIDELNINEYAKKALRFASMVVLFGMVAFKAVGPAYGAEMSHPDFSADAKHFADTHGDDHGHDGHGDGKDKKDDPRSLWDKLTGKKVSTSHAHYTDKQIEARAKAKKMSSEEYLKYLQEKEGWTLDSVKSDTLHKTILVQKPDTMIHVTDLSFDIDGDQFLTGKFDLSPDVKADILAEIDSISAKGGIITNYAIESSTDKEPIKMGNDVLAQKRADAVSKELVALGIDDSLITVKTLPEQGPDLYSKAMTAKERLDAREDTKEFRYVKVHILYYDKDIKVIPEIKKEFDKVKNTYYLSKQKVTKPPHTPPFKVKKSHKTHKLIKNKGRGKSCVDQCWYGQ